MKGKLSGLFHKRTNHGKLLTKAIFSDSTGSVNVIWFNQPFLKKILYNGQKLILSGKAAFKYGKITLQNPAYEEIQSELMHSGRIVPIYHQTEGINSKWVREKLKPLIDEWSKLLIDYMPDSIKKKYELIPYDQAVREVHFPTEEETLIKAKFRLSFDELFLLQLKALQKKWHWQNVKEHQQKPIPLHPETRQLIDSLPFELTEAQNKSVKEILNDLQQPYPMSRLLQGDVGSGKTIVAGIAIFNAIKAGYQVALMAPTEILAKQHLKTIYELLKIYSYNINFISGSINRTQKKEALKQISTGTVNLIIGTHSLIQEGVEFKNLGLAVIDEQHRFGVKQREILHANGHPHLLNLSATPIPRTLAMTIYGDQDLSIIDQMPKGRLPIITRVVPEHKRRDAYLWIKNQIIKGRQAFVICPLIDESDTLEVTSAIQEHQKLSQETFPNLNVGLLHGKMKAEQKEEIMKDFADNKINVLVSTSVIEVGIDVSNASIMLIEGADRFGLSQLHQFRGRVGRGEHQSYCFLFPKNKSEDSRIRLSAMQNFTNGFKLAEIDLQLRGPGEIFGLRQSGIPDLKMASLTDSETIALAREAASELIDKDPRLHQYALLQEKLAELQDIYIKD